MSSNIHDNLTQLNQRIDQACAQAGRERDQVTLIGVSKTKPFAAVQQAHQLGVGNFGENYADEASVKIEQLKALDLHATWHFIGRIQSNKTRLIAQHFDWVHTIDRAKIADRLNQQRGELPPLQVLLQINIDQDDHKAGVRPDQAAELLAHIQQCHHLVARGLMTILAKDNPNPGASYRSVAQLHRTLAPQLTAAQQQNWDTLSMGMTADLEAAVAAGATHIRIGTALFGAR